MKLIVLDSYAAVSTDLSLDCLKPYCDRMEVYERTPPELLAARIGDAEAILVNKTVITRSIMEQCPNLRYIGLFATGYNVVDIVRQRTRHRGIQRALLFDQRRRTAYLRPDSAFLLPHRFA